MPFRAMPGWVIFQAIEAPTTEVEAGKLITASGAQKMSKVLSSAVEGIVPGDILVLGDGKIMQLDPIELIYAAEKSTIAAIYEKECN